MPRDYKVYLQDVVDAAGKVRSYTTGQSFKAFSEDTKTVDAVVRNLEVIGEAIKQVPDDFRSKHADVEWKKIAGLRDILVHQYFGVDVEIIWDIVQNKLPALEAQIRKIIEEA